MSQLYCDQCGYRSREFYVGGYSRAFGCRRCCQVSVSKLRPFVYEPPNCELCSQPLLREEHLRVQSMRPEEDIRKCPQCLKEGMRLTIDGMHLQIAPDIQIPAPGQLLHAQFHEPSSRESTFYMISVPRMWSWLCMQPKITNRDWNAIRGGYHEFRTIDVIEKKLAVEYVRELDASEWQWLHS